MGRLFATYKVFYKHRKEAKDFYIKCTLKKKLELKRYIYSNVLIKPFHKDLIWEYLNEPIGSDDYVLNNRLRKEYTKAKIWE